MCWAKAVLAVPGKPHSVIRGSPLRTGRHREGTGKNYRGRQMITENNYNFFYGIVVLAPVLGVEGEGSLN